MCVCLCVCLVAARHRINRQTRQVSDNLLWYLLLHHSIFLSLYLTHSLPLTPLYPTLLYSAPILVDVSHFVHPDTAMDKEAAHRSTSTYLVGTSRSLTESSEPILSTWSLYLSFIVPFYSVFLFPHPFPHSLSLPLTSLSLTFNFVSPERRLDMLPGLLTTELCSLRSKEGEGIILLDDTYLLIDKTFSFCFTFLMTDLLFIQEFIYVLFR